MASEQVVEEAGIVERDLVADPIRKGHSWESFVIESLARAAPLAVPYYYRDHDKNEIDLVLEFSATDRIAVEIKSGGNPKRGFYVGIERIRANDAYVVKSDISRASPTRLSVLSLPEMIDVVAARAAQFPSATFPLA
jgi:predicted AAA+ superfamily ATPase